MYQPIRQTMYSSKMVNDSLGYHIFLSQITKYPLEKKSTLKVLHVWRVYMYTNQVVLEYMNVVLHSTRNTNSGTEN